MRPKQAYRSGSALRSHDIDDDCPELTNGGAVYKHDLYQVQTTDYYYSRIDMIPGTAVV